MRPETSASHFRSSPPSRRQRGLFERLLLAVVATTFTLAWIARPEHTMAGFAMPTGAAAEPVTGAPAMYSSFASSAVDEFVHSPSVTYLPDGSLMATWFAGSREGGKDVVIRSATYDPQARAWGEERTLVTREATADGVQRYIRKLGNPVIALAPDNRLWLFYVSVSVGGWAGSAINAMYSDDAGNSWSQPRRLITSPFLNISTLVRTAPVFYSDGAIGLPVYHEFLGKFAELLYMDRDGQVVDKFRITSGGYSLQPSVVPLGEQRAIALLRCANSSRRVLASETRDGGRSWSAAKELSPWNPNSSLAAAASGDDDGLLVVMNNLRHDRFRLGLYATDPQLAQWHTVAMLDQSPSPEGAPVEPEQYAPLLRNDFLSSATPRKHALLDDYLQSVDQRMCKDKGCEFQYEYPYIVRARNGDYHIVYAWNNSFIKHVTLQPTQLDAGI